MQAWQGASVRKQDFEDLVLELHKIEVSALNHPHDCGQQQHANQLD